MQGWMDVRPASPAPHNHGDGGPDAAGQNQGSRAERGTFPRGFCDQTGVAIDALFGMLPWEEADYGMTAKSSSTAPKYTAPALEKGLDIIEFLAGYSEPRNTKEIAQGLNRSRSEIFRMICVLERRGYLEKAPNGDTYEITDKLFSLRRKRSFAEQIAEIALAKMESFCQATGLSCHLSLRTGNEIIVILRVEHPENLNVSVPIGHRRRLIDSPSGCCILAYSDPSVLEAAIEGNRSSLAKKDIAALEQRLAQIRKVGYAVVEDSFAVGVSGISAPIVNQVTGRCDLALTTTILQKVSDPSTDLKHVAAELARTAREVSQEHYV